MRFTRDPEGMVSFAKMQSSRRKIVKIKPRGVKYSDFQGSSREGKGRKKEAAAGDFWNVGGCSVLEKKSLHGVCCGGNDKPGRPPAKDRRGPLVAQRK